MVAVSSSVPPVIGSRKIGIREVAGMGSASVIHQVATQSVTASTARGASSRPVMAGMK